MENASNSITVVLATYKRRCVTVGLLLRYYWLSVASDTCEPLGEFFSKANPRRHMVHWYRNVRESWRSLRRHFKERKLLDTRRKKREIESAKAKRHFQLRSV